MVVVVSILMFFVACRCAVVWHRHLLLSERAIWTPPWPNGLALRYALWLMVLFLLGGAVQIVLVLPLIAMFEPVPSRSFAIAVSVIGVLTYSAIIALLAPMAIRLPGIAIEDGGRSRDPSRENLDAPIRTVLIATAVPIVVLGSLVSLLAPVIGWVAATVLLVLLQAYQSIVALTGLTEAYALREHMVP